jgi:chromosomal replication initiator protein
MERFDDLGSATLLWISARPANFRRTAEHPSGKESDQAMIARILENGQQAHAEAADQVVGRIRTSLAGRIGADSVTRYFDARVRMEYAPGRLDVRTQTKFMANLLGRRFGTALREAASDATGTQAVEVAFDVDPAGRPGTDEEAPKATASRSGASVRAARKPTPSQGPVTRYRLDDFVVGATNRLAYEAACQFAARRAGRGPGDRTGPATLFLHGVCGLGKTHLLHGIASKYVESNPGAVVRVVTGEAFTNEFIGAVQAGREGVKDGGRTQVSGLERFRRAYRRVDLLCIDDVHFLTSKAATQSELLHTFDELDLSGACIVLASDEHPRQVKKFSDALVSRFMAGLVTRIDPPDQALCERLLRSLAQRRGLTMDDGVVRAIVTRIAPISANGKSGMGGAGGTGEGGGRFTSVRDIEGLMTRIEAYARLGDDGSETSTNGRHALPGGGGRRVGMLAAQQALGQQWGADTGVGTSAAAGVLERRAPVVVSRPGQAGRTLKLEQITGHVCRVLGVEFDELTGNGRRPQVVLARSLISRLARRLTTLSFPEIARGIGRPTHSTIIAACQRLEAQMAQETQPTVDLGGTILTVRELCERMEGELGK